MPRSPSFRTTADKTVKAQAEVEEAITATSTVTYAEQEDKHFSPTLSRHEKMIWILLLAVGIVGTSIAAFVWARALSD